MQPLELTPRPKADVLTPLSPCGCSQPQQAPKGHSPWLALPLLVLWVLAYAALPAFADWLAFSALGLSPGSHMGEAVRFFIYDGPKVLLLLTLVVFCVGIVQSWVTPELTRRLLAGRRALVGNVMAACLGIVTPFCSCSAVPLFIGFVTTGIPLGVTLSFLISAPMVNEVALVLLWGLFGPKVALLYLGTGLSVAIVAGWIIGRLHLEHLIEDWVSLAMADGARSAKLNWRGRVNKGFTAVHDIVAKVWLYMLAGIAIGAGIHGYVPEDLIATIMGSGAWWAVPAAVVMGIPMYTNAAGIIPVVSALFAKGAALGTVLAFMMSVIALSLPEMVILRKVLKPRLIAIFASVVGAGILLVGFLFNAVI